MSGYVSEFTNLSTKLETGNVKMEVNVEGDNNTVVVVPPDVYALYEDDDVRKAAYAVARPLERPGVDLVEFRERRKVAERIGRADLAALRAAASTEQPQTGEELDDDEPEEVSEEVITVDLRQGVFKEEESFKFFDGETSFYAKITDKNWWGRILDRTDGFYEGDRLKVRVVSRQTVDEAGKLHRERERSSK